MFRTYVPNPPGSRAAWEAYRNAIKNGGPSPLPRFGGSSLANILNIGYESPYMLYDELTGARAPPKSNANMLRGEADERKAYELWSTLHPDTWISLDPTRPFGDRYMASVDGIVHFANGGSAVFEIKSWQSDSWERVTTWEQAGFPFGLHPMYYPQLEVYCQAHECNTAILFATLRKSSPAAEHWFEVPLAERRALLSPEFADDVTHTFVYKSSPSLWKYIEERRAEFDWHLEHKKKPSKGTVLSKPKAVELVANLVRQNHPDS